MKKDFSSKDFDKTYAKLGFELPSRLVHKKVLGSKQKDGFSKERNHSVHIVDLPSKFVSMTIGSLISGQTTHRHRHTYETLIYVLEGSGWTEIENQRIEWQAGDALYIPQWAWHRHGTRTDEKATYLACENAPHLQNMGLALREQQNRDF